MSTRARSKTFHLKSEAHSALALQDIALLLPASSRHFTLARNLVMPGDETLVERLEHRDQRTADACSGG